MNTRVTELEDLVVTTGGADDPRMASALVDGMFRLRHTVFNERLGWDVESKDGREQDEFDDCKPTYVIAADARTRRVVGCCRVLPTTGPYMLNKVFSQALNGGQCTQIGTVRCVAFTCSTAAWLTTAL